MGCTFFFGVISSTSFLVGPLWFSALHFSPSPSSPQCHVPGVLDHVAPEAVGQLRALGLHLHVVGLRVHVLLGILQVVTRVLVQSGPSQRLDPGQDLGKRRLLHMYA